VPPRTVVPVLQGSLRGARWITGASTHGCWLGTYELPTQRVFKSLIKPGDVIFDVGAMVGFFTLLSSRLTGPQGRVVAFEPLPRNLTYLDRHLDLNDVPNVTVVRAAVYSSGGEVAFTPADLPSMGRISEEGSLTVRSVRLDDLVSKGQIAPPNLIKMDIEGGEVEALSGAKDVLGSARPSIVLSTHGEQALTECTDFLRDRGYSIEPFAGHSELICLPHDFAASSR
jgi:FkbM family methyltransferase